MSNHNDTRVIVIGLPITESKYLESLSQALLISSQEANVDNPLLVDESIDRTNFIKDTWWVIMSIVTMALFDTYSLTVVGKTISRHALFFENNIYDSTASAVGCLMEDYSMDLIKRAHQSNIAALQEGGLLYTGISDVLEGIVERIAWDLFMEIINHIHGSMYSNILSNKLEIADITIGPRRNVLLLYVEVYN